MLDTVQPVGTTANRDTLLDLLHSIEQAGPQLDRRQIAATYFGWIDRNTPGSELLHAAWFNLAVDLGETGDDKGARHAYRMALDLRADFHPAALNLGIRTEAGGDIAQALAIWQQALQPDELRTALLAERHRLAGFLAAREAPSVVLHVGCGAHANVLPQVFSGAHWRELRIDIDPAHRSDPWAGIADGAMDAVYAPHCLARLAPHQVQPCLGAMRRVLKLSGTVLITTPDLQEVARHVAQGQLDAPLYQSPLGPIAAHDILFGHRSAIAEGNQSAAHHTGFTEGTLAAAIVHAGFAAALVQRDIGAFNLLAIGFPTRPDEDDLARASTTMLRATAQLPVLYTPTP